MPEPDTLLLHQWLRRTAAASPDAPAIVEEEKTTTFAELLKQAESLSATFMDLGVRKGDRVALVLPKTTEAIVSLFAALMSGAMYVPIFPRWPKERIDATIEDCAPRVVLRAAEGAPLITDSAGRELAQWGAAVSARRATMQTRLDSADSALILFTSGSTGRPKGVVLSHRAVAAFVAWTAEEFRITGEDRVASPAPLGFDLSTFDIFNMALCGAACVLIPENVAWMPRFVVELMREARITCWYSVPSILTGMIEEGGLAKQPNPDLRLILFAGEVFPGPNLSRLQAAAPGADCVNLYGPTETNVVTWYRVPPGFRSPQPPPIGLPCPYAEVARDAETGELLARGESTMTGYWNRPEETEQAFLTRGGARYYRTGDRVKIDESGLYVFLGRADRQVKRRGFRIELGEIEAAMARHASVLESAAVAWKKADLTTMIGVFVKLRPAGELGEGDAKNHCARFLPPYMLPDRIFFLDAIPKGNRGKIDYAALSALANESTDGNQG